MNFPVKQFLHKVFNTNTFEREFEDAFRNSNFTVNADQITFKFTRIDPDQEFLPTWREFIANLCASMNIQLGSNLHGFSREPINGISYKYEAEHVFVFVEGQQKIKATGNTIYTLTIHESALYPKEQ